MRRGSCTRGRTSNSHSTSTTRPNRNSSRIKIPYEKRLRFDRIELRTEFVRDISRRFRIHSKTKLDKTRIIQRERKKTRGISTSSLNTRPRSSIPIAIETNRDENHDDWTQLQVARACSGRSRVPVLLSPFRSHSRSLLSLLSSRP